MPYTYYSHWWPKEEDLRAPQVQFSKGIKAAVFLARNCGSKNNREKLVKELTSSEFRVDSLSSCLNNRKAPPGVNLKDKKQVMSKYLFYLAFENQRTDGEFCRY